GSIVDQTPNAGRPVEKDTVIYVTISVGEEKIRVGDYKLNNYDNAKAELEKAGFNVEPQFEYDDEVPENYVISHTPEAGDEAPKGSTIKLVVSKGPEEKTVTVPNFVGKTLEQAKAAIEKGNLTLGDVSYEKSVVDEGTVIRQNISGGETVGNNTPINLVVSSGNGKHEDEQPSDNDSNKGPKEKYLTYTIDSDKDEVTIRVVENGSTIYDGLAFPGSKPEFYLKVSGTGEKSYEIYIDGNLAATKTINFDE
ncbi:MAG: PASTA domain-containing protein, partial [Clostridia bacterium]|nr:PASTA domain-containing protein [Clostridia bacterium]